MNNMRKVEKKRVLIEKMINYEYANTKAYAKIVDTNLIERLDIDKLLICFEVLERLYKRFGTSITIDTRKLFP